MIAHCYLGWYRDKIRAIRVNKKEAALGIARMPCVECDEIGEFVPGFFGDWQTDTWICVACKGQGYVYVNCQEMKLSEQPTTTKGEPHGWRSNAKAVQ